MPITRREMLIATAALPLAARLQAGDAPHTPVVDTHVHCFAGRGSGEFPYDPRGPYNPERPATPEMLLERMKQAEVDYAIIVHPEPYQEDHRYFEYCMKIGGSRLKGTCLFFADRDDAPAKLRAFVKRNADHVVAVRMHAYAPDRLPSFDTPAVRDLWKAAADLNLAIQLHFEPRFAGGFEPMIKEFSRTTVIIDHLGRPLQATAAEHAAIIRWSRYENTVMKLSALPPREQYPHRDITPFVRDAAKAFTPQRLMYGGGFDDKATAATYRAARERVRGYIAHLTAAEQAMALGGNAARIFGFGGGQGG